jgi:hypothetical protein
MSLNVEWDDEEKTIILVTQSGGFAWDEWETVGRELEAMIDSVDHRVDVITDISDLVVPKDTLANFPKAARMPSLTHPSVGLTVFSGGSRFVQTLANLFDKVYRPGEKLVFVSTLEEAYEVIAEHRQARDKSA